MIIHLIDGREATIDLPDFWIVLPYEWRSLITQTGPIYAVTGRNALMHRILVKPTDEKEIDHVDGNGLNNRRDNLRIVSRSQNMMNASYAPGVSGYRGVKPNGKRWSAYIQAGGVARHIGTFDTPEEAAKARDDAAYKLHGKYAFFNFPTRFEG